jgi:hypothetical protein
MLPAPMTQRTTCFGSRKAPLTQALAALAWLSVATPAAADESPTPAETSATDAPEPAGRTSWGPIIAACFGVLAGGWIARKQIQGWKGRS